MTIVAVVIAAGIATYGFTRAASTNCDADSSVQPVEAQFVSLLNTYRAQNGAGPLTVSPTLQRSARWMANDLASHNGFSHTDSLGRAFQTRILQCGATGFLGETWPVAGPLPRSCCRTGNPPAVTMQRCSTPTSNRSDSVRPGWPLRDYMGCRLREPTGSAHTAAQRMPPRARVRARGDCL